MQTNGMPEREIDLRCLFWKIVSRWRTALACALIGAVLLGGFGAVKAIRANRSTPSVSEEDLVAGMDAEDVIAVDRVTDSYRGFREYEKRLKEGNVFDLNPYDITHREILYYVNADSLTEKEHGEVVRTYNSDLQNALRRRLSGSDVQQELAEIAGVNQDMLWLYFSSANAGSSSFIVTILTQDAETSERMDACVRRVLDEYSAELQTAIGPHVLQIISDDAVRQFESNLETQRNNNTQTYDRIKGDMKKKADELTGAQRTLYDIRKLAIDREYGDEIDEGSSSAGLLNKKYLVLGFAAGFFLACVWILLSETLGGKIQNPEDAGRVAGGYVARIPHGRRKGLDGWIEKRIRGRGVPASEEEALGAAVAELKQICAAQGIGKLSVQTTAADKAVKDRAAAFAKALTEAGVPAEVDGAAEAVVFYEASGGTRAVSLAEAGRLAAMKKQAVLGTAVEF